jgi:DNA-directed RNA polymerase specialized sigma24 family protein
VPCFHDSHKDDRIGEVCGDEDMTGLHTNRIQGCQSSQYTTSKDFCQIFADNLSALYVLSFLLTGDHELAERGFVAGLEECVESNHAFSEWAHCWAKRIIVQNAIRAVQPYRRHANALPSNAFACDGREPIPVGDFELYRVLALEDFERFVFVMSVLERYSDHDCAVLLGCSLQEVGEARIRALEQMGDLGRTDPYRDTPTRRESRQVLAALNALGD